MEAQQARAEEACADDGDDGLAHSTKEKPLLPEAFAGWDAAEKPKTVTDPAELDGANAAALKEYGCTGGVYSNYKRSNETLQREGADIR